MSGAPNADYGAINSDTFDTLASWRRGQAEAVARVLRDLGAYIGSEADALTDATRIVLALRFSPEGDNHHNASMCPYCTPQNDGSGTAS